MFFPRILKLKTATVSDLGYSHGAPTPQTIGQPIILAKILSEMHENERNWIERLTLGGGSPSIHN